MVSAGVAPIVIIPSSQTLIRSPLHDSAIVQSERLGGNFAYAIAEGQSFHQTVSPVIASVSLNSLDAISKINQYPKCIHFVNKKKGAKKQIETKWNRRKT